MKAKRSCCDLLYARETVVLADSVRFVCSLIDVTVTLKNVTSDCSPTSPTSAVIVIWSRAFNQLQQRDILMGLNAELLAKPEASQRVRPMVVLDLVGQDSPFLTYMHACGSVVLREFESLVIDLLLAIEDGGHFLPKSIDIESPLGRQIRAGCGAGDGHGKCWQEHPDAVNLLVPWLSQYCRGTAGEKP